MKFEELRLAEPILRAVAAEGYTTPTPIQIKAIPHILSGVDLLGCAQTGTGKTAAFALPILQRLAGFAAAADPAAPAVHVVTQTAHAPVAAAAHAAPAHRTAGHRTGPKPHTDRGHRGHGHGVGHGDGRKPRALILSPTRELTVQIGDSFKVYGKNTGLKHCVIFGGVGQRPQTDALHRGIDIIVATPGRLLDLMNQGHVDLTAIEVFVLDEADRMLDMGFIADIRKIVAKVPKQRQTLMFSATMPTDIRKLASSILNHPVSVEVTPVASTVDTIQQSIYHVDRRHKPALLTHILKSAPEKNLTLVFTRTKHGADRVVRDLVHNGVRADAIHGNKRQNVRQRTLESFRTGRTPVLVATDIAARGIDIDDIALVVNYDLPDVPETYVHRIGRTARAGASGQAIAFCDREERPLLKDIERLIRRAIPVHGDVPDFVLAAPQHVPPHSRQSHGGGGGGGGGGGHGHRGQRDSRVSRPSHASSRGGHGGGGGGAPGHGAGTHNGHKPAAKPSHGSHSSSGGGGHHSKPHNTPSSKAPHVPSEHGVRTAGGKGGGRGGWHAPRRGGARH